MLENSAMTDRILLLFLFKIWLRMRAYEEIYSYQTAYIWC